MVICESGSTCLFRVYLPQADSVELVGGFTGWRNAPIRLVREPSGWWFVRLDLPPGDHDFSYLVDGATWLPDYAASGIRRNGYGGWVSQIVVERPSPAPALCAA